MLENVINNRKLFIYWHTKQYVSSCTENRDLMPTTSLRRSDATLLKQFTTKSSSLAA